MKTFKIVYTKPSRHEATLAAKTEQEAIGKFMAFQPDSTRVLEVSEMSKKQTAQVDG